jgi:tetratricopeptide (TPR) repeat protein
VGSASTTTGITASNALLARAQVALARRAFSDAQRDAETVLRGRVSREMRASALLVAADAAYGARAYPAAARHYAEFVAEQKNAPEAARATLALGWARLRSGDPDGARAAWSTFADTRPVDARAPTVLALAAELASQTGDTAEAERLLDRLVARYPSSPVTGPGRLSRASLLLQRRQDSAALRDLEDVVRTHGPPAIDERRKLAQTLASGGGDGAIEPLTSRATSARRESGDPLERFAARLLDRSHRETSPYVLHGVVLLAAKRGWADTLTATLAGRLVEDFPSYAVAPQLLARVADAAAASGQWSLARRAWETILADAPTSMGRTERLVLAEAQIRTGETVRARRQLEELATGGGEEGPRALLLLAQLHAAAGDRRAALASYERLQRDYPRFPRPVRSLLAQAQLLDELGEGERGRPLLRRVVETSQGDVTAEAAYRLGQIASVEGQHAVAVEWYFTALYAAERSTWGRQAILGAGRAFTALNEKREALATYRKLIPKRPGDQSDDREASGEAAYRAAEILHGVNAHGEALELFKTSARLTAGLPSERRALLGALHCVAGAGDRKAAEAMYRRLQQVNATESELAQARQAMRANGRLAPASPHPESALPKPAR